MSLLSAIGATLRAIVLALFAGAAAFGLLVVFEPFREPAAVRAVTVTGTAEATSLQQRIGALRIALSETEAALEGARSERAEGSPGATSTQYEAQIAAAAERRDLALRHAEAIRTSLEAGLTPSSLAEIRESVVIGQLLAQQVNLGARIATEGARLKANHPVMRGLHAQQAALATQIRQEVARIAVALEAEAKLDDEQIGLLKQRLQALAIQPPVADISGIAMKAAAQRAELDGLVDAYLNIPPAAAVAQTEPSAAADPLNVANIAVSGATTIAALLFLIVLAANRRQRGAEAKTADARAWEDDHDSEVVIASEPEPLRKAS